MATTSCSKSFSIKIWDSCSDASLEWSISGADDATGITAGTHTKLFGLGAGKWYVGYGDPSPWPPSRSGINTRFIDVMGVPKYIVSTGGGESFTLGHDGATWFGDSCTDISGGDCPTDPVQWGIEDATLAAYPLETFDVSEAEAAAGYDFAVTISGVLSTFCGPACSGAMNFFCKRIGQP